MGHDMELAGSEILIYREEARTLVEAYLAVLRPPSLFFNNSWLEFRTRWLLLAKLCGYRTTDGCFLKEEWKCRYLCCSGFNRSNDRRDDCVGLISRSTLFWNFFSNNLQIITTHRNIRDDEIYNTFIIVRNYTKVCSRIITELDSHVDWKLQHKLLLMGNNLRWLVPEYLHITHVLFLKLPLRKWFYYPTKQPDC